eukprot:scaffold3_cov273-Pinguiococcus_pyrenoidosus.AAC.8
MLDSATSQGARLDLNMTALEDPALLEALEKLSLDSRTRAHQPGRLVQSRSSDLSLLKNEHQRLQNEASRLNSTNEDLHRKFAALEESHAALEKERAGLLEEVNALKNQLRMARGDVAEAKDTFQVSPFEDGASASDSDGVVKQVLSPVLCRTTRASTWTRSPSLHEMSKRSDDVGSRPKRRRRSA